MLHSVLQPAIAIGRKDFLDAIRSHRVQAVSILLGIVLVAASLLLGFVSVNAASGGEPPDPHEVWFKGPNGVLTGIAFGLAPIVLPPLPILTATRIRRRETDQSIFGLLLTKPVPAWGPAAGKLAALYAALAIPTVIISLGASVAVGLVMGAYADVEFVLVFTAANVLLVGLYLFLTLAVGTLVPHGSVPSLVALVWVGFNVLRPTSANITARLLTIIGEDVAATFQVEWLDLGTFTGLYQALLAPSVPPGLGFVIPVGSGGSLDVVAQAIPWITLGWFLALFVVQALCARFLLSR